MSEPVFRINATEALGKFGNLAQGLRDKGPVLRILGSLMLGSVMQTFYEEGSPAGSWRRVFAGSRVVKYEHGKKNSRKAFKRSGENTAGFLRWNKTEKILGGPSGSLARTVTFAVDAAASLVRIGSNWRGARIHQLGGTIVPKNRKFLRFPIGGGQFMFAKKVTMPARPYLVLRPEDPACLAESVRNYLVARFGNPAEAGEQKA